MGLSYLVDTNVLLSVSKRGRIDTPPFEGVLEHLVLGGTTLYYTLQNAAEYWNVFTRPFDRNWFCSPRPQTSIHIGAGSWRTTESPR